MSTPIPAKGRVAVVGAGISGLAYAFFLNKLRPDVSIKIYEKQRSAGGWIKTEAVHNTFDDTTISVERGPRTLRGVSEGTLLIVDILRQLGCADEIRVMPKTSVANKKYLLDGGGLVQVPDSWRSLARFMRSGLGAGLVTGLLGEPFRLPATPADESVEAFMRRRLGSTKVTDNVFSAVLHGIYAGDVARLSAQSIVPRLTALEREHGSLVRGMLKRPRAAAGLSGSLARYQELISPGADLSQLSTRLKQYPMLKLATGLQRLPAAMAAHLAAQPNVDIEYGASITLIDYNGEVDGTRFDHIRSTINTNALSGLLANAPPALTAALRLEYVSIFLVNVYSKKVRLIPREGHGFGFLVPKKAANPEGLLGVIYDSDVEQNSQPLAGGPAAPKGYHKVTLMMGGHHFREGVPSTQQSLARVRQVLTQRLGVDPATRLRMHPLHADRVDDVSVADDEVLVSYVAHRDCIPQYNVGYGHQLATVHHYTNARFLLGGMAFGRGIGVPDCVQNALEDALELSGR
jgi:oxygen-dependent protoporphyrinogen oxidase